MRLQGKHEFLLSSLSLEWFATRIDVGLLGLLLRNRNVNPRWSDQDFGQFRLRLAWLDVDRPEAENNDLTQGSVFRLWGIGPLKRVGVVEFDSPS